MFLDIWIYVTKLFYFRSFDFLRTAERIASSRHNIGEPRVRIQRLADLDNREAERLLKPNSSNQTAEVPKDIMVDDERLMEVGNESNIGENPDKNKRTAPTGGSLPEAKKPRLDERNGKIHRNRQRRTI